MLSGFTHSLERWPLARPFRISRASKTEAIVVVVEARSGDLVGRGEAVPYARYGETPENVSAQLDVLKAHSPETLSREALTALLPAGAARNAVDCALWDLEAQQTKRSVAEQLRQTLSSAISTALTVSLDSPENMAASARLIAAAAIVKIKVDASQPQQQIDAVASAAPSSHFIVDPNEGWSFDLLHELQPFLAARRVVLVEQPLPASADDVLSGWTPQVPICADESLHTRADLARIAGRYQFVNIKLDKTGGLTEALALQADAEARGLGVMVGCMVCTSLGIAPALHIALDAEFVDLDAPWWLARDRRGGFTIADGKLSGVGAFDWGRPRDRATAPGTR